MPKQRHSLHELCHSSLQSSPVTGGGQESAGKTCQKKSDGNPKRMWCEHADDRVDGSLDIENSLDDPSDGKHSRLNDRLSWNDPS
jgi:hypothetical protein